MEAIKIVRIELNGYGIFNSCEIPSYHPVIYNVHERHNEFPNPYQEGLKMGSEWFCAYKTIEQVQKWIMASEIRYFIELGFKVLLLTVDNYQVGQYQVIYTKDSIKSQEDITSLFI